MSEDLKRIKVVLVEKNREPVNSFTPPSTTDKATSASTVAAPNTSPSCAKPSSTSASPGKLTS